MIHFTHKQNLKELKEFKMATTYWFFGESVMTLLFDNGNFQPILRQIFFELDPESLANCSLVCKNWSDFISKEIWTEER